jgi:uncharacterized protein YdaU (DUF1376 family)
MAKDPALLWYPGDWTQGTQLFTFEEKGAYITLLMIQFEAGSLSIDDIKYVLGNKFDAIWNRICVKFKQDEDGKYYQWRIREEKIKRVKFTESRKKNLEKSHMRQHMKQHMENENENENVITVSNNNTTQAKKTNDDFAKDYQDSHTQVANGIRVLKINNLRQDEENLLHLLQCFVTALNHANAKKQSFNEFTQHFTNWIGTNGAKYGLKKRAF